MLSPSDFNNAVPKFTNGNYASNPLNPQYIAEPTAVEYNRGAEPLQTLPAQWWNWFLNKFTGRFNKVNTYVKNIFDELTQLMTVVNMTPSGTEATPTIAQLKTMFETEYPKYMALLMYPVGSIYWTGKAPNDGGDPNTLFGGTWVQIKDKFVWAKGDSDTLNATGGAKTVTLTTSQIPSHSHSVTASGTIGNKTAGGTIGDKTAGGTISITTNPTFTGTAATSGGASTETVTITDPGHIHYVSSDPQNMGDRTAGIKSGYYQVGQHKTNLQVSSSTTGITANHAHTHSVTATGTISGGAYKFTGTAHNHTFTGTAHNHTFTGTEVTSGSAGGGQSHENMPPYVVKYCWERTA